MLDLGEFHPFQCLYAPHIPSPAMYLSLNTQGSVTLREKSKLILKGWFNERFKITSLILWMFYKRWTHFQPGCEFSDMLTFSVFSVEIRRVFGFHQNLEISSFFTLSVALIYKKYRLNTVQSAHIKIPSPLEFVTVIMTSALDLSWSLMASWV